jgi:pantothenate kinase-related protein Tda10
MKRNHNATRAVPNNRILLEAFFNVEKALANGDNDYADELIEAIENLLAVVTSDLPPEILEWCKEHIQRLASKFEKGTTRWRLEQAVETYNVAMRIRDLEACSPLGLPGIVQIDAQTMRAIGISDTP